MKASDWSDFLRMTWRSVKGHWQDNGRIQKIEELVKYCLKPGDIEDASDQEIRWLYEQTERLKLAQPMGPFAAFMAELDKKGEKIVRVRTGEDGKLQRVRKSLRLNHRAEDEDGEEQDASGDANPSSPSSGKESSGSTGSKPCNLMLGVSLPQWRHTPWAEPLILVQRYDPTATGVGDIARLEEIDIEKRLARDDWDNGGGPAPEVALDVAAKALAGSLSERDAVFAEMAGNFHRIDPMEGGEADLYRVHTCGPTVPATPVSTGARTDVAASWEGEPPPPRPSWCSKLPPPDLEDDLIPFDAPPSAFVSAMRAEHGCASTAMAA